MYDNVGRMDERPNGEQLEEVDCCKGSVQVDFDFLNLFKIKICNRYGVGNRVQKFHVSTMEIEPVVRI